MIKLCRLRYGGSAHTWGFAIYRASHDDYEDSYLPNGMTGAHQQKPSTVPAASTSMTRPLGPRIHRRTQRAGPLGCGPRLVPPTLVAGERRGIDDIDGHG